MKPAAAVVVALLLATIGVLQPDRFVLAMAAIAVLGAVLFLALAFGRTLQWLVRAVQRT